MEKYQELIKLPQQMKEMQDQLQEQIEGRTAKHLDRIDRRAITTYTTITEIRSQIHKIEKYLGEQQHLAGTARKTWMDIPRGYS